MRDPAPYRPGPGHLPPGDGIKDENVRPSKRGHAGLPGQLDFFQLYPLTYTDCWDIANETGYRYQTVVAWIAGRAVINRKAFNWILQHKLLPKHPDLSAPLVEKLRQAMPDPKPEPGAVRDHDPHATDRLLEGDAMTPAPKEAPAAPAAQPDVSQIVTFPWLKSLLSVAQLDAEERLALVRVLCA